MQTFDWSLTQAFLATAETGSLSAAARQLGRSQPTVGRQIQALEEQLGVTLFQRAPRGLILTEVGNKIMPFARSLSEEAGRLSLAAESTSGALEGTVRITASDMVATYYMPDILRRLMHEEPQISIDLVATDSMQNLLTREADIAVRIAEPDQNDVIAQRLGSVEIGLFGSDGYFQKFGKPQTFEDLSGHLMLGFDKSDLILRRLRSMGMEAKREMFRFRTDNQLSYLNALRAGVGIGGCSIALSQRFGGLTQVLHDLPIPPLPVYLVAHQELRTSARIRHVYDYLSKTLKAALRTDGT